MESHRYSRGRAQFIEGQTCGAAKSPMKMSQHKYYEFFAGGGMARAGLGAGWQCLFANDFDQMKAATYAANWGSAHLLCEDVAKVQTSQLPGAADLAWASFPCQDLSLAGDYLGLGSAESAVMTRSGTFWPFWALMRSLKKEKRAPRVIVLENVYGALTSRGGKDFAAICAALSGSDYWCGAIVIDAARFVPQSRQRVFFIAVESSSIATEHLTATGPSAEWHPRALVDAHGKLSEAAKRKWLWWNPPVPTSRPAELAELIQDAPSGVEWHKQIETDKLLGMMTALNRAKVTAAQQAGKRMVGCLYKRTRADADGVKHQRAEVRFDGIAGCLRTPGGGSSRQTILVVDGQTVRSRLLSPREAARLMGLPDSYKLPDRYNDAYHVAGDGVCVDVVRHLSKFLLEPVIEGEHEQALLPALS
jgi:DNA (cytosine-5)-methyltransferase 1